MVNSEDISIQNCCLDSGTLSACQHIESGNNELYVYRTHRKVRCIKNLPELFIRTMRKTWNWQFRAEVRDASSNRYASS
jgi:hypothetical protein